MPDDPQKDEATKDGDEILRRMLKTPPKSRKADDKPQKSDKPVKKAGSSFSVLREDE